MTEPPHSLSPFRWQGADYTVLQCEFVDGVPTARVHPPNPELAQALIQRVLLARERLRIGFGFKCFESDAP
jgi:hypothetical protein